MPVRQTEASKPDVSTFSPKDIILAGIETERLEVIPLDRILIDSALIDVAHANELGISMREKRGQITPIAVRARLNEKDGDVVYDIIDGFHRTAGKKGSGDTTINATVIYGCSDEEMYDLRILAASSVRSVQFARIAEWVTSSFAITPWAEKGLSVSQAFGMVVADRSRSNLVEMTQEELKGLKEWVNARCTRWGKAPGSVYQDLRVVANADPELVKEVRMSSGGDSRKVRISPMKLALVVNAFPGDANHALQREILHFAIANKLKIEEIGIIVGNLRDKIKPEITEKEIKELIRKVKLDEIAGNEAKDTVRMSSSTNKREEISRIQVRLENDLFTAEEYIARLLVDAARQHGKIVVGKTSEGETIGKVKAAILVLPSEFRTAFILQQELGFSSNDIAKILGQTESDIVISIRKAWELIDGSKARGVFSPKERTRDDNVAKRTAEPAKTLMNGSGRVKKSEALATPVSPQPVKRNEQPRPKIDAAPKVETNRSSQPSESKVAPTVLVDFKGGVNGKRPEVSSPLLPEHLDRKPEDFKKGEKVWFLKSQDGDKPGTIVKTEFMDGRCYVRIEFPPMRHRNIFGDLTTSIPITQFDNRYSLA